MLEHLRLLAVLRLADGWSQQEVAEFLGVSRRSVRRWAQRLRKGGTAGLLTQPRSGRPPKLSADQADDVLAWLDCSACEFGFVNERWTAPRVAQLIEQNFGVSLHKRYLNDWLARHGITPQMPQHQPQERNQQSINAWLRYQWPRIKKRSGIFTQPLDLPMKADSCFCP